MQVIDKRYFRRCNFDDADEFLEQGDYRSALNIIVNTMFNVILQILSYFNVRILVTDIAFFGFDLNNLRNKWDHIL